MASTGLMGWTRVLSGMFVVCVTGVALAQPKPKAAPLEGATEGLKAAPPAGFVDDAVAIEADRMAYVVADSSTKAELHVVTLATKAEVVVDISAITLHPLAVQLVGQRALIIGDVEGGKQNAALIDFKAKPGTAIYKIPAATHITVLPKKGIAVHRVTTTANATKHEVELLALENGRRISGGKSLELDAADTNKALDFRVNHWSDGWTKAYGIKGGEWDRKEDQRSPDTEAIYDLLQGRIVDRQKIGDLFEQKKRFQALASSDAGGKLDFVRVVMGAIEGWRAGKLQKIELDQPLTNYETKSLQAVVVADGYWIALKVDPVNAEAVARKKADIEYLDIFKVGTDGKGQRKARVLAQGLRHKFGVMADGKSFYLIEKNQSMDRGGKSLTVYTLQ